MASEQKIHERAHDVPFWYINFFSKTQNQFVVIRDSYLHGKSNNGKQESDYNSQDYGYMLGMVGGHVSDVTRRAFWFGQSSIF